MTENAQTEAVAREESSARGAQEAARDLLARLADLDVPDLPRNLTSELVLATRAQAFATLASYHLVNAQMMRERRVFG